MSRKLKEYVTKDLEQSLPVKDGFVAVDFMGLTAAENYDLRKSLREAGGQLHVIPNRLAIRVVQPALGEAAENGSSDIFKAIFRGPTAFVISSEGLGVDGVVAISKALVEWRRKNTDKMSIKGGFLDGQLFDAETANTLARLPDQKTLYSQVAGMFQAPLRNMVTVAEQVLTRVLYAMNDYKDKLEKEDGG